MIKFFRNIRKQLLGEGKNGKYFKYAIGEIILVVIGILIALQINNWNEQQKENKLEQEYYCRLLEDAQQDFEQVNELILASQNRLKASNEATRLLLGNKTTKVDFGKQLNLSYRAIYSVFTPNNSAFEDLKSGANLKIIKDKNIIKSLNTYFNEVEKYSSIIIINAEIALDEFYSHKDKFSIGWVHATMKSNRFKKGMEKDVYDAINIDFKEELSKENKDKLLNSVLMIISANSRQIELYNYILDEINILITKLEPKCRTSNEYY